MKIERNITEYNWLEMCVLSALDEFLEQYKRYKHKYTGELFMVLSDNKIDLIAMETTFNQKTSNNDMKNIEDLAHKLEKTTQEIDKIISK